VTASAGELRVVVSDNGRGLAADRQESGLANLRQRAALAGGTMTLEPRLGGTGLVLTWRVPLPTTDAPA
jgi:signal transduction histidine kinase